MQSWNIKIGNKICPLDITWTVGWGSNRGEPSSRSAQWTVMPNTFPTKENNSKKCTAYYIQKIKNILIYVELFFNWIQILKNHKKTHDHILTNNTELL